MALSVFHRGTGTILALSTPLLIAWLMILASGPEAYAELQDCLTHWFFKIVLLGYVFSMCYHLCNGIRHMFWDIGYGYENSQVQTSGVVVIIVSLMLTSAIFIAAINGGV